MVSFNYTKNKHRQGDKGVTVCIAALCNDDGYKMIFGAADRMISTQDIEFEPPTPKIFPLTNSIVIMTAGDSALQAEITERIKDVVRDRLTKDAKKWLTVKEIVELSIKFYNDIKLYRSEAAILAPLGLDHNTFLERQKIMDSGFINQIARDMVNHQMPTISTIITGIDESGAHVYGIDDGLMNCYDSVGFCSIGSGARHAESQFMLAGHSYLFEVPETLLLTYIAKKRAEVAPGVGQATDMFIIGPQLGSFVRIGDHITGYLSKIYKKNSDRERQIRIQAQDGIRKYLDELKSTTVPQEQKTEDKPEADGGNIPSDGPAN